MSEEKLGTNTEVQKQEQMIADLQSQVAFQEDELEKLHTALYEQQLRMDAMGVQLKHLADRYKNLSDSQSDSTEVVDEKPPHY